MKHIKSKSGLTLVEIIIAMVMLIIMVVGFTTLYTFAVTTVFIAGHDSVSNADARAEADAFFAIDPDDLPDTGTYSVIIEFRGNPADPHVVTRGNVIRETFEVETVRGADGEINVFRRPTSP
jgi:hypothetical protein